MMVKFKDVKEYLINLAYYLEEEGKKDIKDSPSRALESYIFAHKIFDFIYFLERLESYGTIVDFEKES
jgi:hypothetical protein